MSRKAVESQFQLMKSRRFLPLFLTLFLGAFNDNLFRNCLLVLVVTGMFAHVDVETNTLVNLAAALFVLPFFLFSPLAGQLADKYDKALLVRRIKFAEILIIGCAGTAMFLGSLWGVLTMLFIMGAQSTFFGPIKYSILPQHLQPTELVGGNALVEMGTFVSILLGTMLGTLIGGMDGVLWVIVPFMMLVATVGWLAGCRVPPAEPHAPALRIDWNPVREMRQLLRLAREKMPVWHAILGISWFWLLGMAYLTQMPNFVVAVLGGDANLIALMLCSFTVGIGIGTLLCDRLSSHRVEMGLVPLGSLGLSLFGIDLYFAATGFPAREGLTLGAFMGEPQGLRLIFDVIMLGTFGGFYIVPLNAMTQARTSGDKRARVIACRNIFTSLFMVLAGVLGMVFLGLVGFSIPEFFLALALMNVAVALFIFFQVPEFTLRFLVWLLGHGMYRVRHHGLEAIPAKGGAVLVCNHVSYVDAMLIGGAIHRPVRFVMDRDIYRIPVLNYLFRAGGAIPICPRKENEEAYQQAMDQIAARLEDGELLCIFPEGKLTRNGEIDCFRSGIEQIVSRTPVLVVPLALRGLWGSFFSHHGGLFRRGWKLGARIDLVAGKPVSPDQVSAEGLRQQVRALRGEEK